MTFDTCVTDHTVSLSYILMNKDKSPGHHQVMWDSYNEQKKQRPEYELHTRPLKILSREVTKRNLDITNVWLQKGKGEFLR